MNFTYRVANYINPDEVPKGALIMIKDDKEYLMVLDERIGGESNTALCYKYVKNDDGVFELVSLKQHEICKLSGSNVKQQNKGKKSKKIKKQGSERKIELNKHSKLKTKN